MRAVVKGTGAVVVMIPAFRSAGARARRGVHGIRPFVRIGSADRPGGSALDSIRPAPYRGRRTGSRPEGISERSDDMTTVSVAPFADILPLGASRS
ncbi:hypothetical protein A4X16_15200 [Microbacterium sp. H83]|nr:hypothetical protein A4X16_15200 [Microbacterium sp. H83]